MPRKISEHQKKEILNSFLNGINVKTIAEKFEFSQATIVRQLKNLLGVNKFKELKDQNKHLKSEKIPIKDLVIEDTLDKSSEVDHFEEKFIEVMPIVDGIELNNQKDLASEPLIEAKLPDIVYMLVDKNIELLPKMLKEYPEWSFLPQQDLNRMSLEIFDDHKYAKKLCTKNQKLIKVPNPDVFLKATSSLKSKGITRIIFNNLLLAL